MNLKLSEISGLMWLPREEATQKLTDGFVQMFGEEFRSLFDKYSEKIVSLGIKSGKEYYHLKGLSGSNEYKLLCHLENEEERTALEFDLNQFLSKEEVDYIIDDEPDKASLNDKEVEKFRNIFVDKLTGVKLKNKNPDFSYFKKFLRYKGASLHGELGLYLDTWNQNTIDYYLKENEFFYYLEDVAKKYFGLGTFIGMNELKEEWVNKGIELISPKTSYTFITGLFKRYLDKVSGDFEEEILVNLVRDSYYKKYGILLDALITSKEMDEILIKHYKKQKKRMADTSLTEHYKKQKKRMIGKGEQSNNKNK